MTLHKLTAGDGYTYLTRQVAAQDVTHRGRSGLGTYYTEKGEPKIIGNSSPMKALLGQLVEYVHHRPAHQPLAVVVSRSR